MIEKTPEAKKKTVVAEIADEKITLSEVDELLGSYITQIKSQYNVTDISKDEDALKALKQYRETVLDSLVQQKLFLKEADKQKLKPSDDELKKQVEERLTSIKEMYQTDDAYQKALKDENTTEEKLKAQIKDMIIVQKVQDKITENVKVSESDAKSYYEKNKESYKKSAGADMYHILVSSEDKAKEIKSKLDKGAKFEDLAKEYGTDSTKDSGGSLGYVEYNSSNMDSDFMAAAKKLKDGEISSPVKTQFGYHIIMVKNIQKDGYVEPFDKVKTEIESTLAKQKQSEAISKKTEELKKEYNVKEKKDKLNLTY